MRDLTILATLLLVGLIGDYFWERQRHENFWRKQLAK